MFLVHNKHRHICPGFRISFVLLLLGLLCVSLSESKKTKFRYSHYKSRLENIFENFTKTQAKGSEKDGYFTNTWAVELHEPAEERDLKRIATKHGFRVLDKV
jgi:hypothetical protein